MTQIELSKKIKLPQQTISKLENGLQQETASLIKIATVCGVDPTWLDSGEGEMFKYSNTLSKEEVEWLEMRKKLKVEDRKAVFNHGNSLAQRKNEGTNGKQ